MLLCIYYHYFASIHTYLSLFSNAKATRPAVELNNRLSLFSIMYNLQPAWHACMSCVYFLASRSSWFTQNIIQEEKKSNFPRSQTSRHHRYYYCFALTWLVKRRREKSSLKFSFLVELLNSRSSICAPSKQTRQREKIPLLLLFSKENLGHCHYNSLSLSLCKSDSQTVYFPSYNRTLKWMNESFSNDMKDLVWTEQ